MNRLIAASGLATASALLLTGCVADVPAPVTSPPPLTESAALLDDQSARVIEATMEELAAADEEQDAELLTDRVGGDAVTIREAQYTKATGDETPVALPPGQQAVYASAAETWPRTLATVSEQASEDETPVIYLWVQDSIDDDYRLRGWAHMIPGATVPAMPGTTTGAQQFSLDDESLDPTAQAVLDDYLDLLREGSDSDLEDAFEADSYREQLFTARDTLTDAATEQDGEYMDTIESKTDSTYVMGTADGGALLFAPIEITSSFTVEDATVSIPEADEPLLDGELDDTVTHHYLDMIVMAIPGPDADAKPAVVAADHNLIQVSGE
ncbi:hypothetical protein [Demequina litorisediminis]|uniref:DUF8094 domain-containing protein n=1 Tax=Demequina litorisediminis TaxID=1849022 RepID=A0ABQ6IG15_9MICO|nr:hypothetical protein [Demequina litorisediminis]GMA36694.1 hypothetical protein GCM10025876_28980 [Demequina litorisediminis]